MKIPAACQLVASGSAVSSWHLGSCGQTRRNDTDIEVQGKGSVRDPGATPVCRICALQMEPRALRPHAQTHGTGCSLLLESREFLDVFSVSQSSFCVEVLGSDGNRMSQTRVSPTLLEMKSALFKIHLLLALLTLAQPTHSSMKSKGYWV